MTINSTLDCVLLYERIHNQNDPKKMISDNECLIKLMLRDQDSLQDLIDVYLKSSVHPNQHSFTKLDEMKLFVYSKLLEGNYFAEPKNTKKQHEAILRYASTNKDLVGSLLATSSLWVGESDEYDFIIQALNGYAEEYYTECIKDNPIGTVIHGLARFKQLEINSKDQEGTFVYNQHCLYDLFLLYRISDFQNFIYGPLREEFFKRLPKLSDEEKEKLMPYFDEMIEGIKTGNISYQMGLRLSESKSIEEFMAQIKGPSKKYHHVAFGNTFTI